MATAKLCGVGKKFATMDLQNLLEEFSSALEKAVATISEQGFRKLKTLVSRSKMALLNTKARLMRNDWMFMEYENSQ